MNYHGLLETIRKWWYGGGDGHGTFATFKGKRSEMNSADRNKICRQLCGKQVSLPQKGLVLAHRPQKNTLPV